MCGFSRQLGFCSAIKAELWAVLCGLELALSFNFQQIIVESDSSIVISLLKREKEDEYSNCGLLSDIFLLLNKFAEVKVSHVFREGNSCADCLASLSFKQKEIHVNFKSPPLHVCNLLYKDEMGVSHPCSVAQY